MESVSSSFSAALIHNGTKKSKAFFKNLYSTIWWKDVQTLKTSLWDPTMNLEPTNSDSESMHLKIF